MPHIITKFLFILSLCTTIFWSNTSVADDFIRTISVHGEGKFTADPDMATINLSIYSNAKQAEDAKKASDKKLNSLYSIMKRFTIEKKAASTTYSSLQPRYEYNKERVRRLVEYEANHRVSIEIKALDTVGEVLDALVKADIVRIENISYSLKNQEEAKHKALSKAMTNAKNKAVLLATQAGATLGKVHTITEQGASFRPPMPIRSFGSAKMAAMDSMAAAPAPPSGDIEIHQRVHVTFELD